MVAELGGLVAAPAEPGNGTSVRLRYDFGVVFLLVGRMWWLRPMSTGQVIQRLQDLETVVEKQLDRALSKVQKWDCAVLDEADDVDWTGGGYSCSREGGQMDRQQGGMAQLGAS